MLFPLGTLAALLEELITKARSYRLEKLDIIKEVEELKLKIHFLEAELKSFKELEDSLIGQGQALLYESRF